MSVDIYKRSAIGSFTKEHLIEYTSEWTGERFPDGRPHVPDDIIERMKNVTLTQAWGTCNGDGYEFQFEGGFTNTHPGHVLCGRAVTATFMPKRPDCQQALDKQGSEGGHEGGHIHWTINMLVQGDVYVADVFGKIDKGAIIGDNLAASIKAKSGNGVVHDNGVRDIEGIRELDDFACFVRGWHPSVASPTIMLTGMNCPTRIGGCTVMPGDVVLGKGDAVMFRCIKVSPNQAEDPVGFVRIGGPDLLAVDDEVVAIANGAGLDRAWIGTGVVGLGHCEARLHAPGHEGLEPFFLLFISSIFN